MRFCRFCGYRLGEGVEELVETRLLQTDAPHHAPNHAPTPFEPTSAPRSATSLPMFDERAAVVGVSQAPGLSSTPASAASRPTTTIQQAVTAPQSRWLKSCRPTRRNWFFWVAAIILLFVVIDDSSRNNSSTRRRGAPATPQAPQTPAAGRSYLGASLDDGEGGVLVQAVTPPGSPADLAGLVGGDLITSFDGAPVPYEKDLLQRLAATPVGQEVTLEYVRDGETHQTTLKTISLDERTKLEEAFKHRPEGEGFLGVDPGDLKRVSLEEEGIYGVRLGKVLRNRPADTAGLREGDIVIGFDGVPIRTVQELLARIDRAIPDSHVKIALVRNGQRIELPVKMGQD